MKQIATWGTLSESMCTQACILSGRLELMTGVMAMFYADKALEAEVIILANCASNKLGIGENYVGVRLRERQYGNSANLLLTHELHVRVSVSTLSSGLASEVNAPGTS